MKRSSLEKKIRQKLHAEGVTINPGTSAERGIKLIAQVGANVVTKSTSAYRRTRDVVSQVAENTRDAIHQATKPGPQRKR
jgi:hypothetical protein